MIKNIFISFALLISLGSMAQQQQSSVNVQGDGVVFAVPDKVLISARVEHSGESPADVKKRNDDVVNDIITYLKSEGISAKNIRTEYINLNKDYNHNIKKYSYSANQAISILLEDLEKYETIMSGLLESGLNRIDGVQFQVSDKEELRKEARLSAMLDSQKKAKQLAEALGQTIGKALQISEGGNDNVQPLFNRIEMSEATSDRQTMAPGELEIRVKVNVTYELIR